MLDLDPSNYIFEFHILPDPTEREIVKHIMIPFLAQLVLGFIAALEVTRGILWFVLGVTILLQTTTNGLLTMLSYRSGTHTFRAYQQLEILVKFNESTIGYLVALGIFVGHVITVVLLWLTIHGYSKTPSFFIYVLQPLSAFFIIFIIILSMKQVVAIAELSNEILCNWRAGCVKRESVNGTFELTTNKYIRRKARSCQLVAVTIGKIKVIEKGFQIDWLSLLMDDLANAVLLIEP